MSVNTFVGLTGEERLSSKVMKPPGGGCSDIFGGGPEQNDNGNRRKNHMKSDPFAGGATVNGAATPLRQRPGQDSGSRLFGEPDPVETPKKKNHMKSNILNGDNAEENEKNKENLKEGEEEEEEEEEEQEGEKKEERDPVTGENEEPAEPKPEEKKPEPQSQQPAPRGRIPPGGFSTKLW